MTLACAAAAALLALAYLALVSEVRDPTSLIAGLLALLPFLVAAFIVAAAVAAAADRFTPRH